MKRPLYRPILLCRLCGRRWLALLGDTTLPERAACEPQPTAPHLCAPGEIGIADVVGWRRVEGA